MVADRTIADNLYVRFDLAEFWISWADGLPVTSLTSRDLWEANHALASAQVPPATRYAYFARLGDMIARSVADCWQAWGDLDRLMDELQEEENV